MNITTLINSIRDAVKGSDDIKSWATLQYGREHTVYTGVDRRNPPGADEYPIVTLYPEAKSVGYALEAKSHRVAVICGVYDDTMATFGEHGTDPVEYMGLTYLEEFRKLIEEEIVAVMDPAHQVERLDIEYEVIEFFPYMLASMVWTISEQYYCGDDVFL